MSENKNKSGEIALYYFTGSGNSLYIARELQNRLSGIKLIPIAGILNNNIITPESVKIGIVFPTHGMTIPIPVKIFLKKLNAKNLNYIFAITNRAGTDFFGFKKIDSILKSNRKKLNSSFILNMPNNDPKFNHFTTPTLEEFEDLEKKTAPLLDFISDKISSLSDYRVIDIPPEPMSKYFSFPLSWIMTKLILFAVNLAEFFKANNYFYSDNKCVGCGKCQFVCPSGKVKMINGKPHWDKKVKCFLCYACINFCPAHSSQIKSKFYMKSYTTEKGRYIHPSVNSNDIANQKSIVS